MQDQAQAAGLKFWKLAEVQPDDFRVPLRNSFGEFLGGLYAAKRLGRPFCRAHREGVNQVIDESAWLRWGQDETYRPPFLQGLTPVAIPV